MAKPSLVAARPLNGSTQAQFFADCVLCNPGRPYGYMQKGLQKGSRLFLNDLEEQDFDF